MRKATFLVCCLAGFFSASPAGAVGVDKDRDKLPDKWERQYQHSTSKNSAKLDRDKDGLTALSEYKNKTNPTKSDTDRDGMKDGWEVKYKLKPTEKDGHQDADKDTFSNLLEYKNRTNPRVKDSARPVSTVPNGPTSTPPDNIHVTPEPTEPEWTPLDPNAVQSPDVRFYMSQRGNATQAEFFRNYPVEVDITISNNDSTPARVLIDVDGDNIYETDNGISDKFSFVPKTNGLFGFRVKVINSAGFGTNGWLYEVKDRPSKPTPIWNPTTAGCFSTLICVDLLMNHECKLLGDCDRNRCVAARNNYKLGLRLYNNWAHSDTVVGIDGNLRPSFDYWGEGLKIGLASYGNRLMHWELVDAYCGRDNQKAARTEIQAITASRGGISVSAGVPFPAIPARQQQVLDLFGTSLEAFGLELKTQHCDSASGNRTSLSASTSGLNLSYTEAASC